MIESVEMLWLTLLLAVSVGLTAGAMWAGARLAPWFLRETISAPTVRALVLAAEDEVPLRVRLAACGLATAFMLAALLVIVTSARMAGWSTGA